MLTSLFFSIAKLRSSTKRLTREEAVNLIKRKYPYKDTFYVRFISNDETPYFDLSENTLAINDKHCFEEVILHELGHAVMSRKVGSANHLSFLKQSISTTHLEKKYILASEIEAWNWASENSDKPFGKRTQLAINLFLRSYKNLDNKVDINLFS